MVKGKEVAQVEAVGITEARGNFASIVNGTSSGGKSYVIHSRGRPKAVLLGVEEYRQLVATIEELSDSLAMRDMEVGVRDVEEGRTKTAEEIFGEAII